MWNLIPWKKQNEGGLATRSNDAFGPLSDFRREFDQLWDRFWNDWNRGMSDWDPTAPAQFAGELTDRENDYLFRAELPGFEPQEIDVQVRGDLLCVRAEHRSEQKQGGNGFSFYGSFQRALSLPYGVDREGIDAHYRNGVLEVTLPKTESARGKKIAIRSG